MEFTSTDIQESKTLFAVAIRLNEYYDSFLLPNVAHLYGEDLKFSAIHCMLRMGHLPLHITYSNFLQMCISIN